MSIIKALPGVIVFLVFFPVFDDDDDDFWVCEDASVSYYLRCAEMTFYFFRHWIQTEYLHFGSLNLKLIESISTSQVCTLFFSISLHRNW